MTHYLKFFLNKGLLCGSCIQPKKQFKVQIIGILEEIDSFYWQKCTYEKVTKNLGRALHPLMWTKSIITATFFRETFPNHLDFLKNCLCEKHRKHFLDSKICFTHHLISLIYLLIVSYMIRRHCKLPNNWFKKHTSPRP